MCSLEIIITCQIYNSLTSILNEAAFVSPSSVSCWVTDTSGGRGGPKQILSATHYRGWIRAFRETICICAQSDDTVEGVRPSRLFKSTWCSQTFTNHRKMNEPQWGNTRSSLFKLLGLALGDFWHKWSWTVRLELWKPDEWRSCGGWAKPPGLLSVAVALPTAQILNTWIHVTRILVWQLQHCQRAAGVWDVLFFLCFFFFKPNVWR